MIKSKISEESNMLDFRQAKDVINQIFDIKNLKEEYTCYDEPNIPSGFLQLDKITRGFKRGELMTIAIRSGNGKTAFLLSLVYNIAINFRKQVAIFSPARSAQKIISRIIESETKTSISKINSGVLKDSEQEHIRNLIKHIANAGIFIDESSTLNTHELLLRCHHVKNKHNADIILLDDLESYIEHIKDPEVKKHEMEDMLSALRNISKELNIPVLSFNRMRSTPKLETNDFLPPMNELPDFITDNSSSVMFIHRNDIGGNRKEKYPKGSVELIITKDSNIKHETRTYLKFIESIDRFVNHE